MSVLNPLNPEACGTRCKAKKRSLTAVLTGRVARPRVICGVRAAIKGIVGRQAHGLQAVRGPAPRVRRAVPRHARRGRGPRFYHGRRHGGRHGRGAARTRVCREVRLQLREARAVVVALRARYERAARGDCLRGRATGLVRVRGRVRGRVRVGIGFAFGVGVGVEVTWTSEASTSEAQLQSSVGKARVRWSEAAQSSVSASWTIPRGMYSTCGTKAGCC